MGINPIKYEDKISNAREKLKINNNDSIKSHGEVDKLK